MKQDYWEQILLEAARKDEAYQSLLAECRTAEKEYEQILQSLPPENQEKLDRYITLCEELEHRMTILACNIPRQ